MVCVYFIYQESLPKAMAYASAINFLLESSLLEGNFTFTILKMKNKPHTLLIISFNHPGSMQTIINLGK